MVFGQASGLVVPTNQGLKLNYLNLEGTCTRWPWNPHSAPSARYSCPATIQQLLCCHLKRLSPGVSSCLYTTSQKTCSHHERTCPTQPACPPPCPDGGGCASQSVPRSIQRTNCHHGRQTLRGREGQVSIAPLCICPLGSSFSPHELPHQPYLLRCWAPPVSQSLEVVSQSRRSERRKHCAKATWPVLSMATSSSATFSLVSQVPNVSNSFDLGGTCHQSTSHL